MLNQGVNNCRCFNYKQDACVTIIKKVPGQLGTFYFLSDIKYRLQGFYFFR